MTIRVRFAPSPTGLLHIGNARAALINWLFARNQALKGNKAVFMLRLDDTDLERSKPEYEEAIYKDLEWLGLTHTAFAKQSNRFDLYKKAMTRLIESGRLYPCFETQEELDFKRKRQLSRGEPPLYDRGSLHLTATQKEDFEKEGRRPHWRFLLENKDISWTDLVRGPTHFHSSTLSDPVLVREDGAYLYTLTSVVDDIDFAITHILRGEDHVTNTSVQLQLFQALGHPLDTLTFGHTSLLMDAQGGPLSKRLGSLSLKDMREEGIEPMAINSLLARLGTSNPVDVKLTLDELAVDFDLSSFSRTPPRFDYEDLKLLNHKLYNLMPYEAILDHLTALNLLHITEPLWMVLRNNIQSLKELNQWETICFGTIKPACNDIAYITEALSCLPPAPWTTETWGIWTTILKEKTGRKGKLLFMPLRQALTGLDHGPEMKDLLPLLGYERVIKRLNHILTTGFPG